MKRHLVVPLVVAGVLLAALPALAGNSSAITITAHIGDPPPRVSYRQPTYVVVREPVYCQTQRVIYVERDHRRKHGHKDHGRRHEYDERVKTVKRVYYDDDHRERVIVVGRGWDRWAD